MNRFSNKKSSDRSRANSRLGANNRPRANNERPRVLIVDDENIVRDSLSDWLEDEGFEVFGAEHGLRALELLEKQPVDVAVVDIKMPVMDGLTLLRKIKERYPDLPVIMITAHATIDNAVQSMKEGAYDYIMKPFPPEKLTNTIHKVLDHQRLIREHARLLSDWQTYLPQLVMSERLMSMGEFAAEVAHEINNPLSGVLNYIRLVKKNLERDALSPNDLQKVRQRLDVVESEVSRCLNIVSGLLDFARQTEPEERPIDLNQAIRRTLEVIGHQVSLRNIQVHLELAENLPKVCGDFRHFAQVFTNLIINAVQAMPNGGTLSIHTWVEEPGPWVVASVTDTGVGIPEAHLSKIFEPFFTTKKEQRGTGLGLSVVYGIVKKYGGTIDVRSQVGKGSTFTVKFPIVRQKIQEEKGTSNYGTKPCQGEGPRSDRG